jgi:thiamine-phosphate pyrophosphorylase
LKIIVISSPDQKPNEVPEVLQMFKNGLEIFHVRKPSFSKKQMIEYIENFPSQYRNKMVLHSYHSLAKKYKLRGIYLSRKHRERGVLYRFQLYFFKKFNPSILISRSFSKISDLLHHVSGFDYVFLNPIFDSISSNNLSGGFNPKTLQISNKETKFKVIAMGGITPENLEQVKEMGFSGAALLGAVWNTDEQPSKVFAKAKEFAFAP